MTTALPAAARRGLAAGVLGLAALCAAHGVALPPPATAAPLAAAEIQSAIDRGGAQWRAARTPLSDLGFEEKRRRTGLPDDFREAVAALDQLPLPVTMSLPAALDWRDAGAVTPPRDQGPCGSCWAFASVGNLESRVLIAGGGAADTLDLSEQTLLSCGDLGGCDGGYPSGSAAYIRDRGLPSEGCFGYASSKVACSNACPGWYLDDWRVDAVYGGARPTAAELKLILLHFGPVVGTMAVYEDFYSYAGGVYAHVAGARVANHAFLVIGYDDAAGAFLCKNSWGTAWGEGGYFRIGYGAMSSEVEFADGVVAMGDALWPGMAASAVTVVSPDGGEQWQPGSTQAVAWKARGNPGASVKIELLRGGAVDRVIAAAAPAAPGSFSWTLPAALAPGDDLSIRVTGSAAAAPSDTSDASFAVVTSPPGDGITVTYPAGGVSILRGTQGAVRWDAHRRARPLPARGPAEGRLLRGDRRRRGAGHGRQHRYSRLVVGAGGRGGRLRLPAARDEHVGRDGHRAVGVLLDYAPARGLGRVLVAGRRGRLGARGDAQPSPRSATIAATPTAA